MAGTRERHFPSNHVATRPLIRQQQYVHVYSRGELDQNEHTHTRRAGRTKTLDSTRPGMSTQDLLVTGSGGGSTGTGVVVAHSTLACGVS
jgi:hypothetical protein